VTALAPYEDIACDRTCFVFVRCFSFCYEGKEKRGNDSVVRSWLAEARNGMHLADQRDNVVGTIFAAGEQKEDFAERVCAQPGGM
jgi:hypothetical protein